MDVPASIVTKELLSSLPQHALPELVGTEFIPELTFQSLLQNIDAFVSLVAKVERRRDVARSLDPSGIIALGSLKTLSWSLTKPGILVEELSAELFGLSNARDAVETTIGPVGSVGIQLGVGFGSPMLPSNDEAMHGPAPAPDEAMQGAAGES